MPATEPKSNTVGPMEAHLLRAITPGETTLVDPRTFLHFASVQDRIREQLVLAVRHAISRNHLHTPRVCSGCELVEVALKAAEETR